MCTMKYNGTQQFWFEKTVSHGTHGPKSQSNWKFVFGLPVFN